MVSEQIQRLAARPGGVSTQGLLDALGVEIGVLCDAIHPLVKSGTIKLNQHIAGWVWEYRNG